MLPGHAGPPVLTTAGGGAFRPPLTAAGRGRTRTLATSIHADEPATVSVGVYDAGGKEVAMLPGTLVDYRPARRPHVVIPQTVDTARWLALALRVPAQQTRAYRVVVRAVGPDGSSASTTIVFGA